ncbi:hypothetical protein PGAG_00226 [Phaeocystis globosa virus 12T]|uniref:Uncharacterized protein n=1 Tax=Phaeocystis globosa virus PgV-16T TaxID=3071227 RepID=A0AC59EX85_9VIRU|nr:hypothetical protein PGCG_00266 [Phaeocystis globosa virus]AET73115.1 hypothetical protein PGAG_00226 [Phaeocystis globosa virus 12T]AET73938.1 hypothetical protein PGBG_00230 [Phaeocystis globosa virus 14T]AGM15577.1 hypothetical protein PGCG_00266 [Phaeocystis globosa virus PgV-16T]UYE94307.1 hypothetical protein PGV14T_00266 [Phaeocystis globosa virus]
MKLPEKIRNNSFYKFLFYIFLLIVIFNQVIVYGIMSVYNKNQDDEETTENYKNLDTNTEFRDGKISDIFKNNKYNLGEYPSVQIQPGEILFKHNKFLPECCMYYSDYSSDKGCPCITPEQQNYLQRRGLNRSTSSFVHSPALKNVYFSPTNTLKGVKNEIFLKHNTYINKTPPEMTATAKNEVYSLLNIQERT